MYYILAYTPGGQPIGAVERYAGKAAKAIRRLLPRFGEQNGAAEPAAA